MNKKTLEYYTAIAEHDPKRPVHVSPEAWVRLNNFKQFIQNKEMEESSTLDDIHPQRPTEFFGPWRNK